MFEKFGFMDSVEKINMAAEGFRNEGDMESLLAMAEENGFDEEDARDYGDGLIDEFASQMTAAIARMNVIRREDIAKEKNTQYKGNRIYVFNILQNIIGEPGMAAAVISHENIIADFIEVMKSRMVNQGTDEEMKSMIRAYVNGGENEYKKVADEIIKRYK